MVDPSGDRNFDATIFREPGMGFASSITVQET